MTLVAKMMFSVQHWLSSQLEIARPGHHKNAAMEGLRGIAILLVFGVHYAEFAPPGPDAAPLTLRLSSFIYRAGMSGVDLFFVLSGYLIYGSIIQRPINPLDYMKRRLKRIYPVFVFVLSVYVALSLAIPAKSKLNGCAGEDAGLIALNFLLLPLLPFLGGVKPIINATWSLAYEVFYYVSAPIIVYALNLRSLQPATRLALLLAASVGGFAAFYVLGGNDRAMMFLSGVILYEVMSGGYRIRLPAWAGATALASGAAIVGLFYVGNQYPTLLLFLMFGLSCFDAFQTDSRFGRWLSLRPLRWMGNISYSFYLCHGLLLQAFIVLANRLFHNTPFYPTIIPALLFCLVGSFLVYLAIEKPLSLNLDPTNAGRVNSGRKKTSGTA